MQAKDFFENISELLQDGEYVTVPVPGRSMEPFLYPNRDKVVIKKFGGRLKAGDIPIFKRGEHIYVLHRAYKVCDGFFYAIGDRQTMIEGPIPFEKVEAVVYKAIYNGRELTDRSLRWRFYAHIWRRIIKLRPKCIELIMRLEGLLYK